MKISRIIFVAIALFVQNAKADSIIRDAELESAIRLVANPVFKAAGFKPAEINIYIINNNQVNAYVSGGKNIFIHTALLSLSTDPNMLAGVLAHETGHIYGGHLFKGEEEAKNIMVKSTVGYMLGLAAAAAGSPQAGAAIASGAQQVAGREMLKHTRSQEEAADQSAMNFLDKAGISARGLADLLGVLYSREVSMYSNVNPYTLTHPLSRERLDHVRNHLARSPLAGKVLGNDTADLYARAVIKLDAFLQPPEKTLKKYPVGDKSVNARYARAIGYYKIPDLKKALAEIDPLIVEFPRNSYFVELKGQILFENGRPEESIQYYSQAQALQPSSALLLIQLANAQIASEKNTYLQKAVDNLEKALRTEKNNGFAWHQLGVAYGGMGRMDMSNLALAEEYMVKGNKTEARKFVRLARQYITPGSAADLRINDIEREATEKRKND